MSRRKHCVCLYHGPFALQHRQHDMCTHLLDAADHTVDCDGTANAVASCYGAMPTRQPTLVARSLQCGNNMHHRVQYRINWIFIPWSGLSGSPPRLPDVTGHIAYLCIQHTPTHKTTQARLGARVTLQLVVALLSEHRIRLVVVAIKSQCGLFVAFHTLLST